MTDLILQDRNRGKLRELHEDKIPAALAWHDDCFQRGLQFRVLEVYRPMERQIELYKIGRRGIPGEDKVTLTLNSRHTIRLACDVLPLNCSYDDLAEVGILYGINHPFSVENKTRNFGFIDEPHFEFTWAALPQPKTLTPNAARRKAERLGSPVGDRILRRINSSPNPS